MLPHGKWEDRFGYTFASFPASGFRRPAGSVAQLVEQRTENPCVGGSIPPRATIRLRYVLTLTTYNALLLAGHFLSIERACFLHLRYVHCTYDFTAF